MWIRCYGFIDGMYVPPQRKLQGRRSDRDKLVRMRRYSPRGGRGGRAAERTHRDWLIEAGVDRHQTTRSQMFPEHASRCLTKPTGATNSAQPACRQELSSSNGGAKDMMDAEWPHRGSEKKARGLADFIRMWHIRKEEQKETNHGSTKFRLL
jgi:hypothetical protein